VKAQTTIQILRCFTLGRYTARVVDGQLETEGPQTTDVQLARSIVLPGGAVADRGNR
jgi:hypothetical protein